MASGRPGASRHGLPRRLDNPEPRRRSVEDGGNGAVLRRPRDLRRAGARRSPISARATFTSITDYQTSDKFYTEGGDASPDDGVYFFQGSRPRPGLAGVPLCVDRGAAPGGRGPVRHERRRRLHRQVRQTAFYGYDPDVSFTQETTSFAAFFQDEWSFSGALEADRRDCVTGTTRARVRTSATRRKSRVSAWQVTIIFSPEEIFPTTRSSVADERCRAVVRRHHCAACELDYRPNDDLLLVPVVQPRQQERRIHVLDRYAVRRQPACVPERHRVSSRRR